MILLHYDIRDLYNYDIQFRESNLAFTSDSYDSFMDTNQEYYT